jgi:signal transduction histidine kinase
MAVPLQDEGNPIGFLVMLDEAPGVFDAAMLQALAAFAAQAEVALHNARLYQEVQLGRARLQALSRRLVQVQENERRYVARELHDEAGQALTLVRLELAQLERLAGNTDAVIHKVTEIRRINDEVMENLHRLALDLRPGSLDQLGLLTALATHMERLDGQNGVGVHFQVSGFECSDRLPAVVETTLYRLAHEAVTNALRHARPSQVNLHLALNQAAVRLVVEDDGIGFEPAAVAFDSHLGVLGMRERCELLGGALQVVSAPGIGTRIVGELPLVDSNPGRG